MSELTDTERQELEDLRRLAGHLGTAQNRTVLLEMLGYAVRLEQELDGIDPKTVTINHLRWVLKEVLDLEEKKPDFYWLKIRTLAESALKSTEEFEQGN